MARLRVLRPSPFVAVVLAISLAVAFVGGLTYYGARKFTGDAADTRASEEANSLARLSAFSATGDAFDGYLQILRYADDPIVNAKTSSAEQRRDAMRQLLFLNTNKLASLAIVARDGTIFAATDPSIADVRNSEAFNRTRADLNPTNSDIVLPDDRSRGYVEFTTPLREADGAVWAILYGRADPDRLWSKTLRTSVDGSRNVIINSAGLFSAGVPDDLVRQPWRGAPLDNGTVRADIVGVDSICGLGPIGQGTQIDHGWYVASCLPISLIQLEASRAMGRQALVTSAGAVLAFVVAGGLLWFALNGQRAPASAALAAPAVQVDEAPSDTRMAPDSHVESEPTEPTEPEHEIDEAAAAPPRPTVIADINALRLIEAYEARAARVSEQLRETMQAPLLIATTRADEAYRLREDEPERAAELHAQAMAELGALQDRELRNIGQEMHPALIRLGLPGALRAFAKELGATLTLSMEIDPLSDSVGGGAIRIAIDAPRRLIVFRAVRAAVAALKQAGATACDLSLAREGDWLKLRLCSNIGDGDELDAAVLAADMIAFAAYGGKLSSAQDGLAVIVSGELHAPGMELPDEPPLIAADAVDGDAQEAGGAAAAEEEDAGDEIDGETPLAPLITFAAPLHGPGESLGGAIRELAAEMTGTIEITVDAASAYDEPGAIDAELAGSLRMLVGAATRSLAAAGSPKCSVSLHHMGTNTYLSIMSDTGGDGFDGGALTAPSDAIEARGGYLSVNRRDGALTITAEIPGEAPPAADDVPNVVQIERAPVDDVPKVVQLERVPVDR